MNRPSQTSSKISIGELGEILHQLVGTGDRPLVVHSGLWTLYGGIEIDPKNLASILVDLLIEVTGPRRTLFMPTFTDGYKDGFLNLDEAPCTTGELCEQFRKRPQVKRSASAFFSFAGLGPEAQEVQDLRPQDAWGDGSFYEWLEQKDALCLMLGIHRTNLSYLHRLEWLARNHITYRYPKEITGTIQLENQTFPLTERLFVRDPAHHVENSWLGYEAHLDQAGMRCIPVGRGVLAAFTVKGYYETLMPFLQKDPLAFVKK